VDKGQQVQSASHTSPCPLCHGDGGAPMGSSSLESQKVTVRIQVHSCHGAWHARDGRGWIRSTQCQPDSHSLDDACGQALSAQRAGLPEASNKRFSILGLVHKILRPVARSLHAFPLIRARRVFPRILGRFHFNLARKFLRSSWYAIISCLVLHAHLHTLSYIPVSLSSCWTSCDTLLEV
jgi:hypothetical protein